MKPRTILLFASATTACADAGQDRVEIPLYVAGTDLTEPIVAEGDVTIHIDRAELAFGPLYFCAGNTAGDLCEAARLEWLGSVVVDTIAPSAARAGTLTGVTGRVRSWMYDLGISSQLTRAEPFVLDAAAELGGASLVVVGHAEIDAIEVPFRASIAVQQTADTPTGSPVVRKGAGESFSHTVSGEEPGMLVRFDAAAWLRGLALHGYVEDRTCTPDGPTIACAGSMEQTCNPDGTVSATRDCAALGQTCLSGVGCASELTIEPDSEAFRSIRNALVAGRRPTFSWDFRP